MSAAALPPATLENALEAHERAWLARPLLRRVYREWFELVGAQLSAVPGISAELGSGIARFQEVCPQVLATDVEPTRWSHDVVDAEALPWADGEVANLVLIDVFHHLPRVAAFLDEARRVLAHGGRVVMLEPYCSTLSSVAYRRLHHERTDLAADPFADDPRLESSPLESNQARATLAFFRGRSEYDRRWPELPIVDRRRFAHVVYPLVGGFSRPSLLPRALYRPLHTVERGVSLLAPLTAFRCLVVLERT